MIPDFVTSIEPGALAGCTELQSLTIPYMGGSVKTENDINQYPLGYIFGSESYEGGVATTQYYYGSSTSSATSSVYYIPESLTSVTVTDGDILRGAFYNCKNLVSITLPNGIESIGDAAFYGCNSLETVNIPASVTSIGGWAFQYCRSLRSVVIGDNVTSIGNYAFANCESMTELTIGKGISSIGLNVFANCTSLRSLVIPANVESIAESAFSGCANLESLVVETNNPVYYSEGNCIITKATKSVVIGCRTSEIPSDGSVIGIGNYAFSGRRGLTSIFIPESIRNIADQAFIGCVDLESFEIDEYNPAYYSVGNCLVKKINKTLVVGCPTSVIPSNGSVTSIGNYAFYGCTSLTSITISNRITNIGTYAFYGCTNLTSIAFDGTVEEWNAISKSTVWNTAVPATEVVCSNGTVSLS